MLYKDTKMYNYTSQKEEEGGTKIKSLKQKGPS
jgi:hypothetical protein